MTFSRNPLSKLVVAVLVLAIIAALLVANQVRANPLQNDNGGRVTLSGTLEARQTRIAAEVSARVVNVRVAKGDLVKAGDRLVDLDDSAIQSSLKEAEAGVTVAQAQVDRVLEQARPDNIALADAGVAQAQAELDAANRALDNANRALTARQDLTAQLHTWEARVAAAQGAVGQARAALASVKDQALIAQRDQSMAGKAKFAALLKQQAAAEATLAMAEANLKGSQRIVDLYKMILQNPLELKAAQNTAASGVQVARANLAIAQAELDIVRRPPQPEAVRLAQARLAAAQATLSLVQAQADRYALFSPLDGTVLDRAIEPGETAQPARAVLIIADTRELEMTLYAPVRDLELIQVGQPVAVRVPSMPGESYVGQVSFIAQEGEFKPANIYNSQERSEMVFAIRVRIPNDGRLKTGLPADAVFEY